MKSVFFFFLFCRRGASRSAPSRRRGREEGLEHGCVPEVQAPGARGGAAPRASPPPSPSASARAAARDLLARSGLPPPPSPQCGEPGQADARGQGQCVLAPRCQKDQREPIAPHTPPAALLTEGKRPLACRKPCGAPPRAHEAASACATPGPVRPKRLQSPQQPGPPRHPLPPSGRGSRGHH